MRLGPLGYHDTVSIVALPDSGIAPLHVSHENVPVWGT